MLRGPDARLETLATEPGSREPHALDTPELSDQNGAKVLRDGREAFPEMLRAIAGAARSVLVEMYTFAEDSTGRRFAEALKERARAGVRVRVLYDGVGCVETSRSFFEDMRRAGVRAIEYHPLMPWKPLWGWFFRNHRKLLTIDGRIAFTGGLNLSDHDAPPEWGGHGWRDTEVRLEGPCAASLEELFWATWRKAGGESDPEPFPKPAGPRAGSLRVRVVSSTGFLKRHSIRRSYMRAIDSSKSFIGFMSAYFIPGRSVYRRLIKAAARGVRVAVIVPQETDFPWVRWASWALFGRLLKGGVEVYEYQGRVMHAKTVVIDGLFASIGTHNLDHRSLHFNLEVAVNIFGSEFGALMTRLFEEDLTHCRRVTFEDLKSRSLAQKIASLVLYAFRSWL